ncbi:hypothetical protein [Gordonia rhizosphera]|uniref:Uncharacterized protein n=1 Tax=Gordonia rhizosphera NBRC 16068 TaxID=1108045 RepID=K6WD99_9ACTN|nr:hypothetical protein [Gordonia rhizosphera]GAB91706.1 hypothetical protein GORHZ_141_00810 [Gordonia rhizosphera NBRC 16068]
MSNGNAGAAGGGAFYFMGILGSWVYFWQEAEGFWLHVWAIFQGLFWPAFLIHDAFKALNVF